jgi:hypothetical protein
MGGMKRMARFPLLVLLLALAGLARADSPNFDLAGPPLDVKVMRDGKTLPISQVPNLEVGDRLWLHPALPLEEGARYLLVAVFLRGSTNPPPDVWFTHAETWIRQVRDQGVFVTVPAEARQAIFFLAPETGGDFSTLRSTVRARPGAFVRASQDLNQASLDRSRLDAYLQAVTTISASDPAALKDSTNLLARSLNIKVASDCFEKPADQQLACLTTDQNAVVLDDGHTQSMVAAMTSGASADLIGQLSATPLGGAGVYSPYVGAIVDVVRIMDGFHTAQYQYIPALVENRDGEVQLKLNNPPSFSNPKSVLTVGLPAVAPTVVPPMKAVDPKQVYCAETPSLVLPVDGAPLVYSTDLAHDFVLHVEEKSGKAVDLPAHPDAIRGGFVVDTHSVDVASMDPQATAVLRGYWGFQPFDGPSFQLEGTHAANWTLLPADQGALVVGREDTLHLEAGSAACVDDVAVKDARGNPVNATYKLVKPDELEVQVAMKEASPGPVTLLVNQAGLAKPDQVKMQAYSEGAHMEDFTFHAGDRTAELDGARLDQVSKVAWEGASFSPDGLKRADGKDQLTLAGTAAAMELKAGDRADLRVTLNDGREMTLAATVEPPRPQVALLSKNAYLPQAAVPFPIHLNNPDELPQDSTVNFVLRSQLPASWARTEKLEVGTADGSAHVLLSVEDGGLTLQDANTVIATLNPLKSFGPSAFGPLRFRPVDETGAQGDWQLLGNLVRIPTLKEVRCPASSDQLCTLSGSDLFLLDSVAATSAFTAPVSVPTGFSGSTLPVPRPIGTLLYIKLRDDPAAVNEVSLPVMPEPQ